MPFFRYMGVNGSGAVVKGTVEAATPEAAWTTAEAAVPHLLEVTETKNLLGPLTNWFQSRRVGRQAVVEFANNLAVMIAAGIPLTSALTDLAHGTENPYFRNKIEMMRNTIAMGSSFSGAVKMHEDIFPEIVIRLVSVGEETGNLEGSLRDVAEHLQRVDDLSSALKSALIYPIFALVSALGALGFWLVYVLPKVLTLFQEMKVAIPPVTRFLMFASSVSQRFWPLFLISPVALFFLVKFGRRYERFSLLVDRVKLSTPVMGIILTNRSLALLSEQMRILIKAGLTIDRIFDLVAAVMGNRVYQDAVSRIKHDVLAGSTISETMAKQDIFPPMLLRMVSIGERSGTLEQQFGFLSNYYIKRLEQISQRLGKMLEPMIIMFLGILFAVIIIGLLLPIYDLISNVGRM